MYSSYFHHHPPKWQHLLSALIICINLIYQASTCSTVGQLKCKCINMTTFNCSYALINIMPIMLDPRLKVLDLSHNQIKRIHDLNSIYIAIEHLDISYNLINSNESSRFESKNLKVLNLSYNQLTTINDNMFKGLPDLKELRLEGNKLTTLPTDAFAKLGNLKVLHLELNQISIIKHNAFNGLKRLIELYLNNNLIMFTSQLIDIDGQFNSSLVESNVNNITLYEIRRSIENYKLNQLYIFNQNRLNHQFSSHLSGETTDKVNKPFDLSIEQHINKISPPKIDYAENADALHLSNLPKLKLLDLSSNPLFILNEFNSPFSIRYKDLYKEDALNLPTIKLNNSSSANQLDTLLLNNCSLFKIDQSSFSYLNLVKQLDLKNNLLYDTPTKSFIDLNHLEQLDISRNLIESIGSQAFSPLSNLIKLRINDQKYLNTIHPFAFDRLNKLESLEMNSNINLENLDHQLFTSLLNLRSLSLKNSSLSTLDPRLANLFKKLVQIQVSSRKFTCNCDVQWLNLLLNKLRNNQIPKLNNSTTTTNSTDLIDSSSSFVACSSPDSVAGLNLIDLTTDQLGCYEVKSLIPVVIAFVVGFFILIVVTVICVINCRSSHSICIKQRNKNDEDLKYSGDHLASLNSFNNGPSLINHSNNYAFKLGLYDGINRTNTSKSSNKLRSQNKVFSTSDKPLIGDLSRFDTMYKPPLICSNNFSDILMPNSKSTLINTNKLIKQNNDEQPIMRTLTNPYSVGQVVPVLPPGYEQDYFNQHQQQLLFQQSKTNTLHSAQFLNTGHHFNQSNFHTQQRMTMHHSNRPLNTFNQQQMISQDYSVNDDNEDYSDHTYATVLNGNEIYIGIQDANQDVNHSINHTINPSHLRRLANSDCSSCSSEPLSRLSNDKPITEL